MNDTACYTPAPVGAANQAGYKALCLTARHFAMHRLEEGAIGWQLGHRHQSVQPQYEMLWVTKGAGQLSVDRQVYEISHRAVYLLSPGQLLELEPNGPLEGYYLCLSAEFFYGALPESAAALPECCDDHWSENLLPIDEEVEQSVREILSQLYKECTHSNARHTEIVKALFRTLLLYLSKKQGAGGCPGTPSRDRDLVRQFLRLLRKNVQHKKMVVDYARDLFVTPGYLNQVVKKVSGYTASHHIHQYIILQAKRQAIQSKGTMKEIAYSLGFSDAAHFSKFFKNNAGANFTHFLKANR